MSRVYFHLSVLLIGAALVGCTSPNKAMSDLNAYREVEIQKILSERGSRHYDFDIATSHRAMLITMRDLGMAVEDQDASTGFIFAKGPAPKPLTEQEWERAKAIDKPILKSYSAFMFHTTQGTEYAINVITLSQEQGGIEVSLGIRMVRGKPPTGTIYGTAPPPIAVSMIIDKVWEHFERVVAQQSGTLGDVSVPKT